jgi:hypothetical protein
MATLPDIAYTDDSGRPRELVVCPGAFGSLLVVDRDSATLGDRRLLAHIPADEPPENAALVCRLYLEEEGVRSCRPLVREDFERAPLPGPEERCGALAEQHRSGELVAYERQLYCIRPHHPPGEEPPELRWSRRPAACSGESWEPITLREALTELESYEPICTLTARAIARHERDPSVSVHALRREHERLRQSALVLNRALREAVVDAVERRCAVSMGELALRCGMVKRDRRGVFVGDTSWLARRVGLMPPSGKSKPTRWVHVEVLALIARSGLGVSPREVELG